MSKHMTTKSRATILATAHAILQRKLRGVDQERTAAAALLEKYMLRHGIRADELEAPPIALHVFSIDPHWEWLFSQVLNHVLGDVGASGNADFSKITVPCAPEDVPEIWNMFDRLQRNYQHYELALKRAFVEENRLYTRSAPRHAKEGQAPPSVRPEAPVPAQETHTQEDALTLDTEIPVFDAQDFMPIDPEQPSFHLHEQHVRILRNIIRPIRIYTAIGIGPDIPVSTT